MSKLEELTFVMNVLNELKHYPDHNEKALQSIIDILKYRIDVEEKHLINSNRT